MASLRNSKRSAPRPLSAVLEPDLMVTRSGTNRATQASQIENSDNGEF